jgi:glycosyltransferase involved in cell wall biosynthesis
MSRIEDPPVSQSQDIAAALRKTVVVMPAFNEAESVAAVVAEVRATVPQSVCLVVSDGSTDATADVARQAGATVLELPFNLGVGGAMRAGFRYARANGYDYVVQVDADGQHNPADVPALIRALQDVDIAIGARFAGEGEYRVRGPRSWAMKLLAATMSRIAGTRLTDTTSGFRGAGPRALALFADHYPSEYLGDTVESLVLALRAGATVRQVPVAMRVRSAGMPSQNALRSTIYLVRACLALVIALTARPFPLERQKTS